MLTGDTATAKTILRDYINATVGFAEVAEATHIPSKSLMRMLGPTGNPIWYPQVTAPTRIGRGTWLGERVTVLRGSDVGHHCIVGAHSVVRGTIPDYSVAVGAPARVVGSTREMVDGALRKPTR